MDLLEIREVLERFEDVDTFPSFFPRLSTCCDVSEVLPCDEIEERLFLDLVPDALSVELKSLLFIKSSLRILIGVFTLIWSVASVKFGLTVLLEEEPGFG